MEIIIQKKLTFLKIDALTNLKNNILETNNIEGNIIETGCALGGSAICIALYKNKDKKFNIYDVFDMIPPPTNNDDTDIHKRYNIIKSGKATGIGGDVYYGYKKDLLNEVINNFNDFNIDPNESNINFIKGLYKDTLLITEPVSFAHIDCDFYDPVMNSLNQIVPYLSINGIITIDDYYCWSGCRKAVDEYFKNIKKHFSFNKVANKLNIKRISIE
jgi:asparagine synthase (glutamine-hydrolysing)